MAFWKENTVSPKRNYRFQIQFGRTTDGGSISPSQAFWWAKDVKVPTFSVASVEHHYLDNKYNFPGRTTWEDVSMSLVDPSDPDAVEIILDMLKKSGYAVKALADTPATIGKVKAAQVDAVITMLDEDGSAIETWTLNNCFILSADLGQYDYSSDELRALSLTLKYDWATCEIGTNTFFPAATTPNSNA
jgi:hypothetical protein